MMDMTTTRSLYAVPEPVDSLGTGALRELARSVTVAQNLAAATRFEIAHALVEGLRGELETQAEDDRIAGRPERPAHARLDPEARARDHLASTMSLTCWHAARLVKAGTQIHTRLPRLRSTVARGLLPEQLATDAACRLADVPDRILPGVESEVVSRLTGDVDGGDRPSRTALDAMVDSAVERHDPGVAADAASDALGTRTVRFRPAASGMATLWAKLPLVDAENLRRRLDADARAASDAGSHRTLDQLRADALSELAAASPAPGAGGAGSAGPGFTTGGTASGSAAGDAADLGSDGPNGPDAAAGDAAAGDAAAGDAARGDSAAAGQRSSGRGEPIRITVIAAAAQGLPNRVEFVYGAYSSFDWLCETLLQSEDSSVRFETIDPAPGALDDPDRALKYMISPAMAERIRQRDGTCRHPGCSEPARNCDVDHVIAFDHLRPELGGPTAEWNLMCLCRTHHREKTFGRNAYRPGPLGELIIITDSGDEYRSRPRGALARARDHLLETAWTRRVDSLIADDGLIANPPGATRG